jgi:hypothetical protein
VQTIHVVAAQLDEGSDNPQASRASSRIIPDLRAFEFERLERGNRSPRSSQKALEARAIAARAVAILVEDGFARMSFPPPRNGLGGNLPSGTKARRPHVSPHNYSNRALKQANLSTVCLYGP